MSDDFAILRAVFGPESVEVPPSAAPDDPATVAANEMDELVRTSLADLTGILEVLSPVPRKNHPICPPEP